MHTNELIWKTIWNMVRCGAIATVLLIFLGMAPKSVDAAPHRGFYATLYQGVFTEKFFYKTFTTTPNFEPNNFTGLGAGYEFFDFNHHFAFEVEGQYNFHYGYHYYNGYQNVHELVLVLFLRAYILDQPNGWSLSLAFGDGFSVALPEPYYDMWEGGSRTTSVLNYLAAEVEVGFPKTPLSLIMRIHHRSSIFGLYGHNSGSNFYTLGVRYDF